MNFGIPDLLLRMSGTFSTDFLEQNIFASRENEIILVLPGKVYK